MLVRPRKSLLDQSLVRPKTFKSIPRESHPIWLDKNENTDAVHLQLIKSICADIDPIVLSTYPEAAEAYNKLGDWLGIDPDCILFTPGSDGAIRMTFEAYIEPGDIVVHTNPTFAMYPVYSKMFGANVHELVYKRTNRGPKLSSEDIVKTVKNLKPKLVCLPNPDSPTGTVFEEYELIKILNACENSGSLLLLDEAYHPFYNWSAIGMTKKSKNIIIARTFAKAWGAAGLRVGYAVAHSDTLSYLHKMRPMYEISSFATEFVAKALNFVDEMESSVDRIIEGKSYFIESLEEMGFSVLDTHANFIHVDFAEHSYAVHHSLDGKVLYRPSIDHPCLSGFSRFTVAPKPIMKQVIALIKNVI
jgi:histidinol-phosphate aminotransferase